MPDQMPKQTPNQAIEAGEAGRLFAEADAHFRADRFAEALPIVERAAALTEAAGGEAAPEIAVSCNQMAALHHLLGDLAAAQPLYVRAVAILEGSASMRRRYASLLRSSSSSPASPPSLMRRPAPRYSSSSAALESGAAAARELSCKT